MVDLARRRSIPVNVLAVDVTSVAKIERHHGTLFGGAHAGLVGGLDTVDGKVD
jgi:hypothetical protein